MMMTKAAAALLACVLAGWPQATAQAPAPARTPDVIYVPTPPAVVDAMLKMAKVTDKDVVYDLGSGDGRIPITAAKNYGARGIGIDIDPQRIAEANENAKAAGVSDKVTFLNQDLFASDFRDATVVTLYLLPRLNAKLLPQLRKLPPGARVISVAHRMADIKPDEQIVVDTDLGKFDVYLWKVETLQRDHAQTRH